MPIDKSNMLFDESSDHTEKRTKPRDFLRPISSQGQDASSVPSSAQDKGKRPASQEENERVVGEDGKPVEKLELASVSMPEKPRLLGGMQRGDRASTSSGSGSEDECLARASDLLDQARSYREQGKYSEAEPLYKRALAIREQKLGHDHPKTVTSRKNLAKLYEKQGSERPQSDAPTPSSSKASSSQRAGESRSPERVRSGERSSAQGEHLFDQMKKVIDEYPQMKEREKKLKQEVQQLQQEHNRTREQLTKTQQERDQAQGQLREERQERNRAQEERGQARGQLREAQQERDRAQTRLRNAQQEYNRSQEQLRKAQEDLNRTQEQLRNAQQEQNRAQEQLRKAQQELGQAQAQFRNAQQERDQVREQLRKIQQEQNPTQEQLGQVQQKLNRTQEQLRKAQQELGQAQQNLNCTWEQLINTQQERDQAEQDLAQMQEQLRQTQHVGERGQSSRGDLRADEDALPTTVEGMQEQLEGGRRRQQELCERVLKLQEGIQRTLLERGEDVRRNERLNELLRQGIWNVVSDHRLDEVLFPRQLHGELPSLIPTRNPWYNTHKGYSAFENCLLERKLVSDRDYKISISIR